LSLSNRFHIFVKTFWQLWLIQYVGKFIQQELTKLQHFTSNLLSIDGSGFESKESVAHLPAKPATIARIRIDHDLEAE